MKDKDYIDGLEDGINLVKQIYELSVSQRKKMFGSETVPDILDRFDFAQINTILESKQPTKELKCFYIIRGIKVDKNGYKKVTVESERYKYNPSWDVIDSFMKYHTLPIDNIPQVDFATVECIWVYE